MVQWSRSGFLSLVVCAGCGGRPPATATTGGAGTSASPQGALAPQSERTSQYPAGKADYWCQWREDNAYTPTTYATEFIVESKQVTLFTRSGKDSTVFPLDAADGRYVRVRSEPEDEQRSPVLADKLVFAVGRKPGRQPRTRVV